MAMKGSDIMKALIILLLSSASAFAADTSMQVTTTTKTNAVSGKIFTMEVFTRSGQTNLVRTTVTTRGVSEGPLQKFYHDGVLVGTYLTMPESTMPDSPDFSVLITEAGSPYSVIVKHWPSKNASQAFICTKDRVVLDYFTATNGVFYPADRSAVREANKMTTEMREAISPDQE
jgi:hypothetical protein